MHVTIVDDIKDTLETYADILGDEFDLKLIQNPLELMNFLSSSVTDLILLDIHMPKVNGFELYAQFKELHPEVPVIFLSGDTTEATTILGLELGADDFISKPVPVSELKARVKNKIAKSRKELKTQQKISFGNFILLCDMQQAEIDKIKIQLTPIEFKLIHLFSKNPNRIFSREYITKLVWPDVHVQNQNIDTHLSNLRKKLMPFSKNLKTIKSRGYILRV